MATRHNTCENPSLSVSDAGWGDGGADVPARTAVSGFPVAFAAQYSGGGSFRRTPLGVASVGVEYTVSLYVRPASLAIGSGVIYIEWLRSNMTAISYPQAGFTASSGVVTRISLTATAPAETAYVRVILDGWSTGSNVTDISAVLYEASATAQSYFDGDTAPGGSWDGTTGLSASSLVPTVIGTGSVVLGSLSAATSGVRTVSGVTVATLGALVAAATGVRTVQGAAAATLPGPTATATGVRTVGGAVVASLGGLTTAATGTRTVIGSAVAPLGALVATGIVPSTVTGTAVATLGALIADASGSVPVVVAGGSWYGLLGILHEAAQIAQDERSRPPEACPNDGQPLEHARGVLHCSYDGWIDDGSWR